MNDTPETTAEEPRRFPGRYVLASMLGVLFLVFALLILPVVYKAQTATRVPTDGYEIVNTYPHDPEAFTQGFLYADLGGDVEPAFFESTGLNGRSSLRRVDIETGEVLQKVDVPDRHFAEGLALIDRKLYQLTWKGGFGYIYDARSFQKIGTFPLPMDKRTRRPIEGWGLTTDGESLIVSDGSDKIRFLDPNDRFVVTKEIAVRDGDRLVLLLNELEFIQQEIWANVWKSDSIVRINPKNGKIRGFIDLDGLKPTEKSYSRDDLLSGRASESVLNGIAFDRKRQRVFVTGKLWPSVFEIRVTGRR